MSDLTGKVSFALCQMCQSGLPLIGKVYSVLCHMRQPDGGAYFNGQTILKHAEEHLAGDGS